MHHGILNISVLSYLWSAIDKLKEQLVKKKLKHKNVPITMHAPGIIYCQTISVPFPELAYQDVPILIIFCSWYSCPFKYCPVPVSMSPKTNLKSTSSCYSWTEMDAVVSTTTWQWVEGSPCPVPTIIVLIRVPCHITRRMPQQSHKSKKVNWIPNLNLLAPTLVKQFQLETPSRNN